MKIFLVGGAVRDHLLGHAVTEKDWVVVGADPSELLALGYRQVGRDFPVFLHPKTNEEYALARTERKTGKGYIGFTVDASKNVTLEDDLRRRDLTVNAMAETPDGQLIDPFGGRADLEKRLLRHVSEAFIEDPVRILRVARFAARFTEMGFHVAPETNALMKKMVELGEVDALVSERVWKEFERALAEKHPEIFFAVLEACDALNHLFPQLFAGDSRGIRALKAAVNLSKSTAVRFAALLHDQNEKVIRALCKKYRVPSAHQELALLVARLHGDYIKSQTFSAEKIIDLLQTVDAFRRPERFDIWLLACAACSADEPAHWLRLCFNDAISIDTKFIAANFSGPAIAEQIRAARITKILSLTSQNR